MSTLTLINKEVELLPNDLQKKVLAFVELLKYKAVVQQVEQLSTELGGIEEFTDDEVSAFLIEMGDEQGGGWTVEELQERIIVAERVSQALSRMQTGEIGLSQDDMKKQIRQWQKR